MLHPTFALRNLLALLGIHQEQTPRRQSSDYSQTKSLSKKPGFFARLLGNEEHVIQRDGSHDPRTCKECVELDLLLQRLPETRPETELEFDCKYSFVKWHKALGKGAGGVVKLAEVVSRKSIPTSTPDPASNPASIPDSVPNPDTSFVSTSKSSPKLVAVKEFRKRRKDESLEDYISRLTDEYRIATSLHHNNIIETIDIVRHHRRWYEVMEYCSEGDMFRLLQKKSLTEYEINCCFRQLVEAVWFLHSHGIAHRDLKLENMLLDSHGTLKISDFGVSQVFRANKFDYFHKARGVCGSLPYIAPEEYTQEEYDARAVDVWSLGIIYFALSFNSVPWKTADATDRNFRQYLNDGQVAIEPFARLPPGPKRLLARILEPDPMKRITLDEIFDDPWFARIRLCPMLMGGKTQCMKDTELSDYYLVKGTRLLPKTTVFR